MAISNTCNAVSVRLDENNYPIWSYVMHHHLRGHGLLKFVDGSHPCPPPFSVTTDGNHSANTSARALWFEQDSFLISLITNTLSAQALILVVGCETSMEVWTILKQRYGIISEFHVMQLKFAMQNIRKGSESIDKYLLRFKYIRDRLAVAGVEMSDLDVKYLILAGLPIEYGPTRQIIRGKKDIGMEDVRSLLLSAEYEIELKHKASSASHLVTHNGMMSSGNAYSTKMQWNGLVGIDVPYHCSVMPLSDVHNAYSIASGVSSLNAYNVFPSNAISQIGYVSPSTTMATDTRFIDTCASSISSSFLPSQVSQNNSCCARPTGIFPQIGGGIQNGGSMQVPYGGAISQLHNDSLPQQKAGYSWGVGHQTSNVGFSSSGYQGFSSQNKTEDYNNSYPNFPRKMGFNNNIRNISEPRNSQQQQGKLCSSVESQTCDKPGYSAYKCHHRNFQSQNITSSSSSEHQIGQKPGHSAMRFYCNKQQENQLPAYRFTPKALSATIGTQPKLPSIVTQLLTNASQSQVVKPLSFVGSSPLSIPTHPHLSSGLLDSTLDKKLMNCRQACESMSLWRSPPLIPPD